MRYHLLRSFDEIYIINLHGNSNIHETSPNGSADENVFDIKQGVSINIFVKNTNKSSRLARLHYAELFGTRKDKYQLLNGNVLSCYNKVVTP